MVINLYEPVPVFSPADSNRNSSNQNKNDAGTAKDSNDPLQSLGYEKSSVLLQVEGPYQGLLKFMRDMEQLELLVQPSDLELTAVDDSVKAEDAAVTIGSPRTRLKLRLTFFDQASKDGKGSESDSEASEMGNNGEPPPA